MASNRIKGITIEIDGNTTKLQSALKDVNSSISKTQASLRDVESLLKFDPGNTELLRQKQQYLGQAIEETKKKLEQEKETLQQLQSASNSDKTIEQQNSLKREIIATESSLSSLTTQQSKFGSVAKQQINAAQVAMKNFGSSISAVGKELSKISLAIAGLGTAAVAAFKEVDAGVDAIVKKTGAVGTALESMEATMKSIASSMAVSFEETGEAIGEVNTRFHVSGTELESLTSSFIKFSKITGSNTVTSIDTVQNAMAAFNVDVSSAGTVLDVLNTTSQKTGASVDKMASSLVNNATALQEMGLDIYTSVSFLGQLETAGADSESVISGLKRALKSASTEGVNFSTALERMQSEILLSTSSTQGLNSAYELFGKSGAAVYTAVKNGQMDFANLANTTDVLNESMGSVNTTYQATLSFTDRWKITTNNLKIALSNLGEKIGETLIPMIEKLIGVIQSVSNWFSSLSDTQQTMIVVIGLVVAAIGPLLTMLGSLITTLGVLNIEIAATPVGWIILAIASIVLAIASVVNIFKTLYNECSNFRTLVDTVMWDFKVVVSDACTYVSDSIKKNVENISFWITHWRSIPTAVSIAANNIKTYLLELNDNILNTLHSIPSKGLSLWNQWWSDMHTKTSEWTYTINSLIKEKFESFAATEKKIEDNMRDQWHNTWNDFYNFYISRMVDIINAVWSYFEKIVNLVKSILKHMLEVWNDFWNRLRELKEEAESWGRDIIDNMRTGLTGKVNDLKKTLKEVANTIKDYLGFSEPKKGPLSNFHTYMPDMIDLMCKGMNDGIPMLKTATDKIAETLVPSANTDLQYSLNATTTASVDNLTNLFEDYLPQLSEAQNVNVILQGDAAGVFKVVRQENTRLISATGYHALA